MIDAVRLDIEYFYDKKIAVYGTGDNAYEFFCKYPQLDVAGFLDRDKQDGFFLSKPILTMESLTQRGIVYIIIAADWYPEKLIYDRIREECQDKGIHVYGLHGGEMDKAYLNEIYGLNSNDEIQADFVKHQIDEHDVISFDIFDTLICRKVVFPSDVFEIVQYQAEASDIYLPGFRMNRIVAEHRVRETEDLLDAVYREVQKTYCLSDEDCEYIKQTEIEIEKKVVYARRQMRTLLEYAYESGKQVYLITDMYLSKEIIKELLEIAGIVSYHDIFVSGEIGARKTDKLFDFYKDKIRGNRYLHIGDDREADGLAACVCGMDTILIKPVLQKMKENLCCEILPYLDNINSKILIGGFVAQKWNDPFGDGRLIKISDAFDYVKTYMFPMMAEYIMWLLREVLQDDYDAVLFVSRDGFFLKQMYEMAVQKYNIAKAPMSIYFYSSRSAVLKVQEDSSGILKQGYIKYIESLNLKPDGRYVFCDMAARGTTQVILEDIFFKCLYGKYFIHSSSGTTRGARIDAMYEETSENRELLKSNYMMELFFTSPEPSVDHINEQGEVVFQDETRSRKQLRLVQEVQKKLILEFQEYLALYCFDAPSAGAAICKRLWHFRNKPYSDVDKELFEEIVLDDSVLGGTLEFKRQI